MLYQGLTNNSEDKHCLIYSDKTKIQLDFLQQINNQLFTRFQLFIIFSKC